MESITYHPSTGQIHKGDTTHIDTRDNFSSEVLASVDVVPKPTQVASVGGMPEYDYNVPIYDPEIIQTVKEVKAMGFTAEASMKQVYSLVGDANRQNLRHLQMIRLIPQLLAFPESYFHLHNMFTEISVPQLEARVSLQDVYEQQGPVGRYQRAPDSDLQFAEVKFDLPKYPIRIPTPIEDIYRTLINPHTAKLKQIQWARAKRHNEEAHKALKTIVNGDGVNYEVDAPEDLPEGNFHSKNSIPNQLTKIIKDHLVEHHVFLNWLAFPTELWNKYVENTWVFNVPGPRPTRLIQGVYPVPGIENVMAVVDPNLDEDRVIYAVNKENGALYGQGPMLSKTYDDNERDAMVAKQTEFFEYLMVTGDNVVTNNDVPYDRKFSAKIDVNDVPTG